MGKRYNVALKLALIITLFFDCVFIATYAVITDAYLLQDNNIAPFFLPPFLLLCFVLHWCNGE